MITVAKFGGSSVSNAIQLKKIKEIVESDSKRQILVVSALGKDAINKSKLTDLLFLLYAHLEYHIDYQHIFESVKDRFNLIKKELNLKYDIAADVEKLKKELQHGLSKDYLVSRGEYFTAKLIAEYLGYKFIDAAKVIALNYDGTVDYKKSEKQLQAVLQTDKNIVVPGFFGAIPSGKIKIFSRGGSDLTGSILAKLSKASLYENWTDVNGIYAADPKIIKDPVKIKRISYKELRELSYRGAKVLHQESIVPLEELDIPIIIKNTNNPLNEGTLISNKLLANEELITGISGQKDYTSFNITKVNTKRITNVIKDVLNLFNRYNLNIEHLPTGIDTFSVITKTSEYKDFYFDIISGIREIDGVLDLDIEDDISLLAIVGRNMSNIPGVAGKIFTTLGNNHINIKVIAQASAEISIIIGVKNQDYEKATKAIYDEFYKV